MPGSVTAAIVISDVTTSIASPSAATGAHAVRCGVTASETMVVPLLSRVAATLRVEVRLRSRPEVGPCRPGVVQRTGPPGELVEHGLRRGGAPVLVHGTRVRTEPVPRAVE